MEPKYCTCTPISGLPQPRECTATEMLHEMVNHMACTARILADEAEDWGDTLDFDDLDTQVLKFKQAIRKACRETR
jgi:hypothetical protein